MTKAIKNHENTAKIDVTSCEYYLNRELSWVEFNNRVLNEALDQRTPLLERLKFTGIFSSNLDEYFMVRVAALKEQVAANVTKLSPDGKNAKEQLTLIAQRLRPLVIEQHKNFEENLRPLLAKNGVHIIDYMDLNQEQRHYMQGYFEEQIFPVLTPLAVDPSHPFPYISNLSLSLAVVIQDPDTGEDLFARVKVPQVLPRFLTLPKNLTHKDSEHHTVTWAGVPLEQVIAHNLDFLFPGMNIQEYHAFRITRNTDLALEEDEAEDLLQAIEKELRRRRIGGNAVRIELESSMPKFVRDTLLEELELTTDDMYEIDGLMGLNDLMSLISLPLPHLQDAPWTPVIHPRLTKIEEDENSEEFFNIIRQKDLMLHHPYQSFTASVQRFITCAANDPHVLAMKMTLYRTSGDSPIVQALINAAENGKQVSVLVELKARFDEENNINWAKKLEQAGVHVVYGLVGLKTHTKIVLVVRKEEDKIRRYVHIGTGNYNPKTARLYTDLGLISCREELGADLTDLFNYLTGYSRQRSYRKLLVSPVTARDRFVQLINREIQNVQAGKAGKIVAKMNALVDPKMIAKLYEAAIAGVKIDLIIRGMCCLKPGIEGVSENIKVVSIVGRFLEHSRVYYFYNGGQEELYIGSADWMTRNLDRRVEAITPVEDEEIAQDLQEILGTMLADNRQAWDLQTDGSYIQRKASDNRLEQSSQNILMDLAMKQ
jgi:polyphosphate kinase